MKPVDCGPIYDNADWYDTEHKDYNDDIPFYLECLKEIGNPVLELCCGTGRLTIPMAETGAEVVGLDYSEAMLSQARKKAREKKLKLEFVRGDCRNFQLGRRFKLLIIPYNSIGHIHTPEDIDSLFRAVRDHLEVNGRFIIEMFNPRPDILCRDSSKRYPVQEFVDSQSGEKVIITENNIYDKASQINHIKWFYQVGNKADALIQDLNLRMFYPLEFELLLKHHGFHLEAKYGDFDRSPFKSESVHQILISRKS